MDSDKEKLWCVYIHTCKENDKKYVGQTMDLKNRWSNNGAKYLYKQKNGEWRQPAMARAILAHGWDGFTHEVVADNLTKEEADKLEKELIEKYDTTNPKFGYNIREGGSHGKLSEESIEKMRKTIGDSRIKEKNSFYGKNHTEETKQKIRKNAIINSKKRDLSGKNNFCFLHYKYICVETQDIYTSARLAGNAVGVSKGCIVRACNHENKTAGGFHWLKIPLEKNETQ